MRLLLSGASGFIGSHAAPALSDAGHHLRLLARPTSDLSGLDGLPYQRALADLTTDDGLADACHGIDAVVHLAGRIRARTAGEFHEVNARGTARLARAAAAAGVPRFLYLSSLAAQGPSPHGRPLPPTAPPTPSPPTANPRPSARPPSSPSPTAWPSKSCARPSSTAPAIAASSPSSRWPAGATACASATAATASA